MKNKLNPNSNPHKNTIALSALILAIVAVVIGIYAVNTNNKSKIACIDTAKVLKAYKGLEEMGKNFEDKNKVFKARLDTLAKEFESSLMAFEKKRSSLNEAQRQEEEMKLRKKQEEYAQFNGGNQETLKQEEVKLIQKALERINDKISRYAKSKGYAAVIGATPNGTVIYMGDYLDITDEIIEIVND